MGKLDLEERLRKGELLLLFDALNQMPYAGVEEYRRKVAGLRRFVTEEWPGNQAVVACRKQDYSAMLGFPQVEIERLPPERVQEFLHLRLVPVSPELAEKTWERLRHDPLLELVRNPYYLNMLAALLVAGGEWPTSRAALFQGFVHTLLRREEQHNHPGWPGIPALELALAGLATAMQPLGAGTRLERPQAEAALPAEVNVDGRPVRLEASARVLQLGLAATLLVTPPGDPGRVSFTTTSSRNISRPCPCCRLTALGKI